MKMKHLLIILIVTLVTSCTTTIWYPDPYEVVLLDDPIARIKEP